MKPGEQDFEDSCTFLSRFLAGERGFTSADVLAGISRLRQLQGRGAGDVDWKSAMQLVRRCCEKLGKKDDNYKWASGG